MSERVRNISHVGSVCRSDCYYLLRRVAVCVIAIALFLSFSNNLSAQTSSIRLALSGFTVQNNHQSNFKVGDNTPGKTFATISSTGAGGNWNDPLSWVGGTIPGAGDDVIIVAGATINVNANSACLSITINNTGTLILGALKNLDVNSNWVNDGTLTANNGSVTFKGTGTHTISGSAPSAFYDIIINKGTDPSNSIEASGVGALSNTNQITITNGMFKMTTGTFQFNGTTAIPTTGGFWVNGATLNSNATGTYTNDGYIKISSGTANIGTASGNELHNQNKGYVDISGGTINISGRLINTAFGATLLTGIPATGMSISGGTITVCTVGNAASGIGNGSFDMSSNSILSMTGGTVIFHKASTGSPTPIDLEITSGTGSKSIIGGTFQIGDATTAGASIFRIYDSGVPVYNFTITLLNTPTVDLKTDFTINNQLDLNGPLYLNLQNLILGTSAPAITGTLNAAAGMIVCNNGSTGGEVRKNYSGNGSFKFPVGEIFSTVEYSPITLNFTSGTYASGAYAGIKVVNAKHPNNANTTNYTNRYWVLNTSGISSASYDITNATYKVADVAGTEANIVTGVYPAALPWVKYNAANTGTHFLSATGITTTGLGIGITGISTFAPTVSVNSITICSGSSGTLTATAATDPPFSYSWSVPSGATDPGNVASFTANVAGTYTVTVTDGNGFIVSNSGTVTVNPLPTAFNVSGGGSYCTGGSGVTVSLSGSEAGVNYQLKVGGVNTGSPVAGTGIGLNFGNQTTAGTYTVLATNATTLCTATMTGSVNLTVNALPTVSVNSPTICASAGSATITATILTGPGPYAYAWTVPVTATNPGNTASFSATVAGTYSVIVTDANGCNSASTSGTLTINANPSAPSGTNASRCGTGSITVSATPGAGETIDWYSAASAGTLLQSGSTTYNIASLSSTTTYYAEARNTTTGCVSTSRTAVTATINAIPNAFSVTGGGAYCSGGSGVSVGLSGSEVGYSYQLQIGATPIGSPLTGTGIALDFGLQTTAGTYVVVATNPSGPCANSMSGSVTVTITTQPSATISYSGTPYCSNGGTATVTFSGTTGGTYTSDVNLSINSSTGAVTLGTSGSGPHTVYYTIAASGGCSLYQISTNITITPLPGALIAYTGSPYCSSVGTANVTTTDFSTSVYSSTAGLVINSSSGQVDLSTSTAGTYTVTRTWAAAGGCPQVQTTAQIIIKAPPTTSNAGSNQIICTGGSATLAANSPTIGTGVWSVVSGPSTLSTQFNNTSNAAAVFTPAGGLGSYVLQWTISNSPCTASSSQLTINVTTTPTSPVSTAGTNAQCTQITANWNASANATSYILDVSTVNTFASFVAGYNALNVGNVTTYDVTGLTAGVTYYYRVRATNSCGTSTNSGTIIYATLLLPSVPTATAGTNAQCTQITANWNASANATSYILDVSTVNTFASFVVGYNALNVGNVTTYDVTGLTAGVTYYYRVRATNSCGTSGNSGTITYATLPATPATPGAITGTATQCPGLTGQIYSITAVTNATTYTWTVPTGWTITAGAGTISITVTTGSAGDNGNITVTAGNSCGTSAAQTKAVTVSPAAPAAPVELAGSGAACTQITANWNASTNATSYILDVSTVNTFASFVAGYNGLNVGNVTTYNVTGLTAGVTYYYRIRATNSCGTSTNSGTVTYATSPATPAAPVSTAGTNAQCTQITANWNASANATSYILDVSTVSNFSTFVPGYNALNVGNVTTYDVTGLTVGTTYYYRIRATNSCGTSANSATITYATLSLPGVPTALAGSNAACTQITANWNASANATSYILDVSTVNTFASFVAGYNALNVGNVTTYNVTGLTAGVTYYYRVRATNSCGTSGNSATIIYATSPATPATPGAITGTATQCPGLTGQIYSITAVTNATTYTWTVPTGWTITAGAGTISITVTTGSAGDNGNITVTAGNSCGTSAAQTKAVTVSPAAPAAPVELAGSGAACTQITANWNASTNATSYILDVSTVNTFASFVAGYNGLNVGNVTTYNVTGLTAGVTYYYRIRATNSCGTSTNSGTVTYATSPATPAAPVSTAGTNAQCTQITANWNASANATSYILDVSTVNTFASFVAGYNALNVGNVTTYDVTGLTAGVTYYYRVRATNSCGTSTNSGTIIYATLLLPSVPTATAGTNAQCTQITANWNASANATSYILDVSTVNTFASFVVGYNALNVGNVTTYDVTGLTAGVTYYYRVRATNSCGTSGNSGTITYATLPATPATPGAITGTATQCPGLTGQIYSITAVTNATTYTWTVPTGWTITAGAGTISITVTTGSAGDNGNITVTAGNSCGTSAAQTKAVTVSPAAPAAPVELAGSGAACTQITANWNASTNATSYILDVSTVNTFASFVAGYNGLNVGNVTTYNVTGLTAGVTYYYRIRATNSCGTSTNSGTVTYATSPATPAAPVSTAGTNAQCTQITANWNASANATSYILDVSTVNTFASFVAGYNALNVGNVTTYDVTGLTAGVTYYYRVRATNSCGTSGNSGTIIYATSPATPAAPVATAGTGATCTQITANWNASANATSYILDVSTINTFASFVAGYNALNVGNVTTYNVTGLTAGVTYYYRVRATNSCGTSANSGTITYATSPATPATPGAITGTATQCPGLTGQIYSITAVTNATTYTWTVPTGWTITAGAGTVSITVTTGSAGDNGNITVTAGNSCGTSAAQTLAVTVSPAAPSAPVELPGSGAACTQITANWNASTNATSYILDVSTVNTFASFVAGYNALNVGNVTTYNVTGLTAGITYYYRIRATNSCGTSTNSGTVTYATSPATPAAPVSTAGTNAQCTQITANWNASANATSYILDVSTVNTFASFVVGYNALNVGNVTTYDVTGLTAGVTYYYRVRATNSCGTSGNSGTITYATLPATPATPGAITGTATQCPGLTGQIYSITAVTNATTYTWTVPTGWTITAGAGTISITVTTGSAGDNGNITVTAGNSCGTSAAQTKAVTVSPAAPAAPVELAGSGAACTQITANWNASTNATSYILDVSTVNTFASFVAGYNGLNVGNVTTYNVTGLTAGVTYYYRIRATNSCGTSTNSGTVTYATSPATPAAPVSTAGTNAQCTQITANWNASANATSYILDVSTVNTFASFVAGYNALNVGNVTTYDVTGLTAGVTYYYRVRATNSCGTSGNSGTIIYATSPATPAAPVATAGTGATCTQITANWNASANATSYILDVSTINTFASFVAGYNALNVGNVTTYNVTGLTAGVTYYYRVRATNSCGTSANSGTITYATSPATPATPGAITGTATQCPGLTGQIYSITAVTNATTYTWTVPTGWTITAGAGTVSITVTTGSAGDNGNITVTAGNSCGTSAAQTLAVTVSPAAPSAPVELPGSGAACTQITANWNASTNATSYILDVSTVNTFASFVAGYNALNVGNVTTYNVTGLTAGITYYYRIRATNSCGTSTNSGTVTYATSPATPAAPVSTAGTNAQCTQITANWNASANATSYILDVSTVNTFASFVVGYNALNVGNVTTYDVTGLTAGVTYYYRVRATNSCGTSGNSATIIYATSPATPATPGAITGTTPQCENLSGQIYSITAVTNATTYTWTVPTGWTITAGAGTISITVTTGNAGDNGNITVTAGNSCGTSSAQIKAVTVNATPTTSTAGPDQAICTSTASVVLAANTPTIGTGAWSLPAGQGSPSTNLIQFNSTTNPNATFTYASGTGTYVLVWTITNAPCAASTDTVKITVNALPTLNPSATAAAVCFSATAQTTTLAYAAGATNSPTTFSITWNAAALAAGMSNIVDAALPATPIVFTIPGAVPAGTYTGNVTVKNANGCASTFTVANNFDVTINAAATVTPGPDITVCQQATANVIGLTGASVGGGASTGTWSYSAVPAIGGTPLSFSTPRTNGQLAAPVTFTVPADYFGVITLTLTTDDPTGPCGLVSATRTITVNARPTSVISGIASICNGGSTNISIALTGTGPWNFTYTDGTTPVSVSGINTSPYVVSVSPTSTVTYTVSALSDANCTSIAADRTGSAIITVNQPVSITTQPISHTICSSFPDTLKVVATGTGLTYQWYKVGTGALSNTANITGVTTANLKFLQISTADAGDYYVIVSGTAPCSPVQSNTITITVNEEITITAQPQNVTICEFGTATFSVTANTGSGTLTYQWRKGTTNLTNGGAISGATTSTLTLTNIDTSYQGQYNVVITATGSVCPQAFSANATLVVYPTAYVNKGTLLLHEPFTSMSVGNLGGQNSWTSSGTGVHVNNVSPITYTDYGSQCTYSEIGTGGNKDARKNFTSTVSTASNSSIWTSFLVNVSSSGGSSGPTYCVDLVSGNSQEISRFFAQSSNANLLFGIAGDNTGNGFPGASTPAIYSFNQTYFIVLRYDIISGSDNDSMFLWVNPSLASQPSTSAANAKLMTTAELAYGSSINSLLIQPSSNQTGGAPNAKFDDFKVSTDWSNLIFPVDASYYTGNTVYAIAFSSNVSGATFNWTSSANIGFGLSGTGTIPQFTATNGTGAPITTTITVTATANGCTGPSRSFTITVKPTPTGSGSPANQNICTGGSITPILVSGTSGSTFDWVRDNTTNVTGSMGNSGSAPEGTTVTGTLTNNTTVPQVVTFTFTPRTECITGVAFTISVTVYPYPAVTTLNSCIGGGNVTFTQLNGETGGTWSVTGGGTIDPSTGVFTPTTSGCFTATYSSPSAGCADTQNFLVFPAAPTITTPANTCNAAFTLPSVTPASGFTIQYSIDGGVYSAAPTTAVAGCHTVQARYVLTAACGTIAANTAGTGSCAASNTVSVVIFPATPVITAPVNTCNAAFILPVVTAQSGFTVQYDIDGSGFSSTPTVPTTPGCHSVQARYVLTADCGSTTAGTVGTGPCGASTTVNVVIFPAAPVLTAPSNTCNAAFTLPAVATVSGFTIQYNIDAGGFTASPTIPTTPGCHSIIARYVLTSPCGATAANTAGTGSCGSSNTVNVVIFPAAPTMTALANTCNVQLANITAVTTVAQFTAEYAVQAPGGALSAYGTLAAANALLNNTKGCWTIKARYKLTATCGSTAANSISASPACQETTINAVVFPAAPVLTAPANTCASAFTLPTVAAVTGFNVEYSIDGGAYSASPSTAAVGCHTVQARYALSADCGSTLAGTIGTAACGLSNTVNVVIYPSAPVITSPVNTCASAFTLPTVTTVSGFNIEYSIDGGAFSSSPSTTTPGCHTVQARYVLASTCGGTTAGTAGTGSCAASNTVSVVIFPAAPVITAPSNTCNAAFTLPTVATVSGFNIEYSIDGGAFSTLPSTTTPGCHTIQAHYVIASTCGATIAGTAGTGSCAASNTVNVVIFPAAPSAPTVSAGCGVFTVTPPASVTGFNIEYSFDDGASWGPNSPPTADNCAGYKIKARYVTAAVCGAIPAGTASSIAGCKESPATTRAIDNAAPVITTCPAAQTFCVVAGNNYTIPTLAATDNCGAVTITWSITGATTRSGSGNDASGIFNLGTSTITWTVTDGCGNVSTCTTTVIINPKPPAIIITHN